MVSSSLKPIASLEFEADILVLHHPTTINPRYQAMGKSPTLTSITLLRKYIDYRVISYLVFSALWKYPSNGIHFENVFAKFTNRRKSCCTFSIH